MDQRSNSYRPVIESYPQNNLPNQQCFSPIEMSPTTNQVKVNQVDLMACSMILKTDPQFVKCPYCGQIAPTRTEKNLSYKNLLLCLCCSVTVWGAFQIFNNKDLKCYDSNHYCMHCNALLSKYTAC